MMKKIFVLGLMMILLLPILPIAMAEEEMATGPDRFLIVGYYSNVIAGDTGKPAALISPNKLFIIGFDKSPEGEIFNYWFYCRFAREIDYVNSCLTGYGVPTQTGPNGSETGESGFIIGYCTEVYFILPN